MTDTLADLVMVVLMILVSLPVMVLGTGLVGLLALAAWISWRVLVWVNQDDTPHDPHRSTS
jgi:uncharacterized membrane protein